MSMTRNIAIILAGGVGSRLGLSTPKQFFKVAGKMVIEHTIDTFEHNPHIDEIAIVSNPAHVGDVENLVLRNGWKKVKKILKGGKERYDSSLSAINAYKDSTEEVNLIFHDAVRPLVSQRIINDVCEALNLYDAIDVTVPAVDTIIEAEADHIAAIPDRSRLQRGQTPQAFKLSVIAEAYERALSDPKFKVTDDCGVVVKYMPEVAVHLVAGEESNMKLTYKEDTFLLDKLFQLRGSQAPETLQAEALKGKVAVVFGGSYGIGKDVAEQLTAAGTRVHSFSRSLTGTDVGSRADVAKALKQVAEEEDGRIDFVINTAGVLNKEPLCAMDYSTIQAAVQTNYMGTVNVALEAYDYLKQTHGQLIFFTSSSYTRGRAFYSIYSSTKAAIVNFVQAVAQEWEAVSIRVNCINPERTKTPMRVKNFGQEPDDTLLRSEVVAEATLRCLMADYTGQVIDVKRPTK